MSRGGRRQTGVIATRPVGLEPKDLARPLDGRSLFGEDRPLELEIGSGKGSFLIVESRRRPEIRFLGLERAHRYWAYACRRLASNGCENVRLVRTEAESFVQEFLADECLSAVHIYFPDPWPKTRHRGRRLVQAPFLELLAGKMKQGARLQIATDHEKYFDQIERVVEGSSLVRVDFRPAAAAEPGEMVGSNFERKYRDLGRTFHAIAASKA